MRKYKDFLNVDSEMESWRGIQEFRNSGEEIILKKSGFWSWICPCQVV